MIKKRLFGSPSGSGQRVPRRRLWALVFAVCLLGAGAQAARAQDANLRGLLDRVERLQRELVTLQRHVYRNQPAPPSQRAVEAAGADTLGQPQAARLALRFSEFEAELRALTGQVEEQTFRLDRVARQLETLTTDMATDIERRLQRLEAVPARDQPAVAGAGQSPGAAETADGGGTRILGQITEADRQAALAQDATQGASETAAAPNSAGPATGTSPKAQYDHAHELLGRADYAGAEQALRAFLDAQPDDPLAGNAMYWLGESYYVRERYQEAAVTFAEGYKTYPDNTKAPDNLLKLGKSLAALGSTADACGTYGVLLERYADAPATIVQRARQEMKSLSCP